MSVATKVLLFVITVLVPMTVPLSRNSTTPPGTPPPGATMLIVAEKVIRSCAVAGLMDEAMVVDVAAGVMAKSPVL